MRIQIRKDNITNACSADRHNPVPGKRFFKYLSGRKITITKTLDIKDIFLILLIKYLQNHYT